MTVPPETHYARSGDVCIAYGDGGVERGGAGDTVRGRVRCGAVRNAGASSTGGWSLGAGKVGGCSGIGGKGSVGVRRGAEWILSALVGAGVVAAIQLPGSGYGLIVNDESGWVMTRERYPREQACLDRAVRLSATGLAGSVICARVR